MSMCCVLCVLVVCGVALAKLCDLMQFDSNLIQICFSDGRVGKKENYFRLFVFLEKIVGCEARTCHFYERLAIPCFDPCFLPDLLLYSKSLQVWKANIFKKNYQWNNSEATFIAISCCNLSNSRKWSQEILYWNFNFTQICPDRYILK